MADHTKALADATERLLNAVYLDWPNTPSVRSKVLADARAAQAALNAYRAAPSLTVGDDARDAARYRKLREFVGASSVWSTGYQFTLLDLKTPPNVMRGAVCQHLDAAIDAAISAASNPPAQQTGELP